jgi:hypothetical protein
MKKSSKQTIKKQNNNFIKNKLPKEKIFLIKYKLTKNEKRIYIMLEHEKKN